MQLGEIAAFSGSFCIREALVDGAQSLVQAAGESVQVREDREECRADEAGSDRLLDGEAVHEQVDSFIQSSDGGECRSLERSAPLSLLRKSVLAAQDVDFLADRERPFRLSTEQVHPLR